MFNKVTIAGLGLIGGSIALSLRNKIPNINIVGITRNIDSLPRTPKIECFNKITNYDNLEHLKGSDIVVISTIVSAIPTTFKTIKKFITHNTIVTDVGSVKEWVIKEINDKYFLGSHPMAGSEKSGIENSDPEIFENSLCVITPYRNSEKQIEKVSNFWKTLGMKVLVLPPDIHDKIVAETSHFVHLISFIISSVLSQSDFSENLFYGVFGKGLLDTTRISNSNPNLWVDILQKNKQNVLKIFDKFIEYSSKIRNEIITDNWDYVKNTLENAKTFIEKLTCK